MTKDQVWVLAAPSSSPTQTRPEKEKDTRPPPWDKLYGASAFLSLIPQSRTQRTHAGTPSQSHPLPSSLPSSRRRDLAVYLLLPLLRLLLICLGRSVVGLRRVGLLGSDDGCLGLALPGEAHEDEGDQDHRKHHCEGEDDEGLLVVEVHDAILEPRGCGGDALHDGPRGPALLRNLRFVADLPRLSREVLCGVLRGADEEVVEDDVA
mmetsp:Transcript_34877/g.82165  ORF Transcript_34877/g.82165 Transcript_34877/m.82165 type:complete len:207 (-) Transcript_34877:1197-1817(-)